MDTAPARAPASTTLLGLIGWRALIAALAWWGLLAALDGDPAQLKYFSQVTTLTVALAATLSVLVMATALDRRSDRWAAAVAWCRGASTTYAIVTAVIFQTLLSGDLSRTSSLLEHAVVPALAVLDWVITGPGTPGRRAAGQRSPESRAGGQRAAGQRAAGQRAGGRWPAGWWPATWLVLPIGYLGIYVGVRDRTGRPLYPFLDPAAGGRFWMWVGIMLAVFAVVAVLVWLVGMLRSRWHR